MTTSVRTLQIVCPGMKVPVRNEPNPNGKIKRFLSSEEVIEVFVKTKSGFYELTDNSGFVNKNTKNVSWVEVVPPDESSQNPAPDESPQLIASHQATEIEQVPSKPESDSEMKSEVAVDPVKQDVSDITNLTDTMKEATLSQEFVERSIVECSTVNQSANASEATVIRKLMENTPNIRNVTIMGPMSSGKTTLAESFLSASEWQSRLSSTSISSPTPKSNMTLKMNPITASFNFDKDQFKVLPSNLLDPSQRTNSAATFLLNLIDTPGHADLSGEVSASLRLSDGAIVVADTVMGSGSQTEVLLKLALSERVRPVLFINKLDEALVDLQLSTEDIYQIFFRMVRKSNILISSLKITGLESFAPDPMKGTVVFGSATQNWAFSLSYFARFYSTKFNTSVEVLREKLWGSWSFSPSADGVQWVESDTMDANNGIDAATGAKRAFNVFILNPILSMCQAVLNNELSKSGTPKAFLMTKSIGVELSEEEKANIRGKQLLELILHRWLPCVDTLLEMITVHLPSPVTAQAYRVESLYNGPMDDEAAIAIRSCAGENSAPLTMYISKMFYSEGQKFVAFGRVFSGTITVGQTVRILGSQYSPGQTKAKDLFINPVEDLLVYSGLTDSISTQSVPAGNICGVVGIDSYLLKSGTITTSETASCFREMKFSTAPVINVALNVMNSADFPLLVEGMKLLAKNDPTLVCKTTDYGDNIISAGGEFQLDQSLELLKNTFASGVEFITSNLFYSYRETVVTASSQEATAKSPNQHNRLFCFAESLGQEVVALFDDKIIHPLLSTERKSSLLRSHMAFKHGWEAEVSAPQRLWCFGIKGAGANILSCQYNGPTQLDEIKDSVRAAFRFACAEGPLCQEELRGLKLNLTNVTLHADAIHRGMGQILPTMRRALYAAVCISSPSLMEPMYLVTVNCKIDRVPLVTSLLATRRGTVLDEGKSASNIANMKVYIPVEESIGFANELMEETDGAATCQMTFDHWKVIPGDFRDPNSRLNKLIKSIRMRKGLKPEIPELEEFFDIL